MKLKQFFWAITTQGGLLILPLITRAQVQLCNPLTQECGEAISPWTLYARIIRALFGVVGLLALLFFIIGGVIWLTSGGNPDKIKKGGKTLLWATMGLVVIFMSYLILAFVFDIFGGAIQQ